MMKFLTAGIAAALVLGVALDVLGPRTEVLASSPQVAAKGDRLDNGSNEALCGDWPFYHHACAHDLKNADGRARKARAMSQINRRHQTFLTFLSK